MTVPASHSRPLPRTVLSFQHGDGVALAILLTLAAAGLGWAYADRTLGVADAFDGSPQRVADVREMIDPNTADVPSLRRLPDIGPVRARQILEYRAAAVARGQRAFTCPEDLMNVKGIGPTILKRVREHLAIPEPATGNRQPEI
jgi:DNA uptake protein ComE-like DNA-binding protein